MAQFVSPGVYVRELDFSSFIARISGTVLAIVGSAGKGPVGVPTLLTDAGRAKDIFGAPLPTDESRGNYGLHAALNALNQSGQVYYLRVTDGTEREATATSPIVVNNQVVYLANDDDGITVEEGKIAFTLQVRIKSGAVLGADAFNALVRQFGSKNIFKSSYAPITSLGDLNTAIGAGGAFVQVLVPMATTTKTWGTTDQFVSRFNAIMAGKSLRAQAITVVDDVDGVLKFVSFKTQNLGDLLAQNFEFKLLDDTSSPFTSPAIGPAFATVTYDGGDAESQVKFTAKNPGLLGNGISVVMTDVGNTFSGLPAVSVSGSTITVSINDGVTVAQDVIDAIEDNSSARLLITAENAAGSDGTAVIDAGTATLIDGGPNMPSEITNPVDGGIGTVNASSTWTSILNTSGLYLRWTANSPGEYANGANFIFGKDAAGLSTIEYREGDTVVEKAVGLTIQPSGSTNSFIDALASSANLDALDEADYTLLSDAGSLATALGGIDVITDADQKTFLTWNAYEFYSGSLTTLAGGRSGVPTDYNDLVDAVIGNSADKTGLYAFANRERFDNFYLAAPGFDQPSVIRTGLSIAETAGDMVYVVDGPGGSDLEVGHTVQDIVDWHNGQGLGNSAAFNSSYGVFYHTWQKVQDNFNGGQVFMPPTVLVLEQFAYSENVSEKWFAKAGFKRGRLLRSLGGQSASENNQGDRDFMYSNGNAVNPIVNFQKEGPTIWGQRTLQRNASALDRLNVRDMMNFLKRSSSAACRIDVFDPNDDILLGQVTKRLNPIYSEVRAKRGLNRFEVKFDRQTTTDLNRDNGEVVGYIVVEPTKAAEKIILNFVVTAQGASFSEALAAAGVV